MRNLPVGNGSLLVTFDEFYQIRDVYFPHVGKENHTEGHAFRFGVWVDNEFSWVSGNDWERDLRYLPETLVTSVSLKNKKLGVEIVCHDTVDSYETLFLRQLNVTNLAEREREIRIFLHHDFYISETEVGDTAFFDPETSALIHYKANRYFLANSEPPCAMFATGRKGLPDKQGTWREAESGWLSGAAITEGAVDSTMGICLKIGVNQTEQAFYWLAAGTSYKEVERLNSLVKDQSASKIIVNTKNYWQSWVNKNGTDFADLSPEIIDLFKRSLLIIRTQTDNGGAILAANDSDVTV
ncbi:MAG: glycoside hydrolase family 15 protein, partial [Pyrinomonadaceae bacterium]|nr:glycoside hydrolase family 15 protein [Pyrinomonadaceae bacterium]